MDFIIDTIGIYGLIGAIVIGLGYFYLFEKRNEKITSFMMMKAIMNYFQLLFILLLIGVGISIMISLIINKQYLGIIVPLAWFFISYKAIRNIMIDEFSIVIGPSFELKKNN